MIQEQCDDCFSEITVKINGLVNEAKQSIQAMDDAHSESIRKRENQADDFFKDAKKSYAEFLVNAKEREELADKRENRRSNYIFLILALFATVIGYSYIAQAEADKRSDELEHFISLKIDRSDSPTLNEIKMLRELGDDYNNKKFVRKTFITADTSAYYWAKINIYGSQLRGATPIQTIPDTNKK